MEKMKSEKVKTKAMSLAICMMILMTMTGMTMATSGIAKNIETTNVGSSAEMALLAPSAVKSTGVAFWEDFETGYDGWEYRHGVLTEYGTIHTEQVTFRRLILMQ